MILGMMYGTVTGRNGLFADRNEMKCYGII